MLLRLVLLVSTRETCPHVTDYGLTPPFVDQFSPLLHFLVHFPFSKTPVGCNSSKSDKTFNDCNEVHSRVEEVILTIKVRKFISSIIFPTLLGTLLDE